MSNQINRWETEIENLTEEVKTLTEEVKTLENELEDVKTDLKNANYELEESDLKFPNDNMKSENKTNLKPVLAEINNIVDMCRSKYYDEDNFNSDLKDLTITIIDYLTSFSWY